MSASNTTNIAIVGIGKNCDKIVDTLTKKAKVIYYIDNNRYKQGKLKDECYVYSPYDADFTNIDYFIIAVFEYESLKKQLTTLGVSDTKIISFFSENTDFNEYDFWDINQCEKIRYTCQIKWLTNQIDILRKEREQIIEYLPYEIKDTFDRNNIVVPHISTVEETCQIIIEKHVSMSRYGDGEFQIIFGEAKDIYQCDDIQLAKRLEEILINRCDNHIVALADDYGALTERNAINKCITRRYMTNNKRMMHYGCIDMERQYYNAYISRPYAIYDTSDLEGAKQRFDTLKQIWDSLDLLLVEGEKTRMGVGNNLFSNAKSVKRIIAPNENAFLKYEEIYNCVNKYARKDQLILIALGPTATVLAYDLAKAGFWALDVGHIDLEYEWFLNGESYSYVLTKYNNETAGDTYVSEINNKEYDDSILFRITLE